MVYRLARIALVDGIFPGIVVVINVGVAAQVGAHGFAMQTGVFAATGAGIGAIQCIALTQLRTVVAADFATLVVVGFGGMPQVGIGLILGGAFHVDGLGHGSGAKGHPDRQSNSSE